MIKMEKDEEIEEEINNLKRQIRILEAEIEYKNMEIQGFEDSIKVLREELE